MKRRRDSRRAPALVLLAGVLLAAVSMSRSGSADDAPAATAASLGARWHFVFEDVGPRFAYSLLFTRDAGGDETTLLLEADAGRFELVSRQDPTGKDSTEHVKAVATGEVFSRRLVLSRYEHVAGCEGVQPPDACVLLTGARGKLATSIGALGAKDAAPLRQKAEALVSETLKERLFRLEPVFRRSVEFEAYMGDFLALVWPDRFRVGGAGVAKGRRTRGCAFDAEFGRPCSEREKKREESRFAGE